MPRVPPLSLQGQPDQSAAARRVLSQVMIDLVHLAAEAENHRARHVWMIQDPCERPLQLIGIGPNRHARSLRHAGTRRRRRRCPAALRWMKLSGDQLGGVCGAIDAATTAM